MMISAASQLTSFGMVNSSNFVHFSKNVSDILLWLQFAFSCWLLHLLKWLFKATVWFYIEFSISLLFMYILDVRLLSSISIFSFVSSTYIFLVKKTFDKMSSYKDILLCVL